MQEDPLIHFVTQRNRLDAVYDLAVSANCRDSCNSGYRPSGCTHCGKRSNQMRASESENRKVFHGNSEYCLQAADIKDISNRFYGCTDAGFGGRLGIHLRQISIQIPLTVIIGKNG